MQKILIHTCCADCLLNTVKNLREAGHITSESNIALLFYNPNIHPRSEYLERLRAVQSIIPRIEAYAKTKLIIPNYSPKEYFAKILPNGTDVGTRCIFCWQMRLKNLFEYAKENGFEKVTTTLLTSHYQDRDRILQIANTLAKEYDIALLEVDHLCNEKHTGFYKQNYCGCCFSLTEKYLESHT